MKIDSADVLLLLQKVGLRTGAKNKQIAYKALFAAMGLTQLLVKGYPVTDLDEEYGSALVYQFVLNKIGKSFVDEGQRGVICAELARVNDILQHIISNIAKNKAVQ